ncbi:C39 family peptidase [Bacillus sp. ISL-18]|uniref:C39 family peptidase n=1 Tax=Bacillus sp. ISL-18 TaxID=2819118 RepID=UPI001BE87C2D|nr:C39 family peptidase [Bacillus sp. ISL-18]MBT2659394.1 C39 family peptidase [Bacillus sp. ISL-18]
MQRKWFNLFAMAFLLVFSLGMGVPLDSASAATGGSSPVSTSTSGVILKKGSRGPSVTELQRKLTSLGYNTKGIDGIFGVNTENAVRQFQKARHLQVDGIVGPATAKALGINIQSQSNSMVLNVPLINQMAAPRLKNGCEMASLAMVLNYHGVKVTKNTLANQVNKVPWTYNNGLRGNPNVGFVGDMANGPGLAVYNGPVLSLAKKYVGNKAVNLTKKPFSEVLSYVGKGLPVWIITTTTFAPVSNFQSWNTPQGPIRITYSEHSVVITGYDQNYIYINNPYGNKNQKLNKSNFIKAWEQMGSQAIVIIK